MVSIMRNIKIWGTFLLGILIFSCTEVESELPVEGKNGSPTLSFDMTRSPQSIVDNTQVYIFDNPSWDFYKPVLNITSNANKLTMPVDAGTWNLALVTAETSIASNIKSPVRGETRTGKMWETQSVGGELPSMPELRTAYISGQQVIANQQNYGNETAVLYRNVAQVKVIIDKTRGLDPAGTHKLELSKVPTTLNWAGGLYPDKIHPAVSADPLKGTFTIKNKANEPGIQDSDTLSFIIPAHKGNDFLGAHKDTTEHKLEVSVDLACLGGVRYQKANVTIPRVPRVNGILLVKLSMIGQLEVNAEIIDWVDEDLNADLTQTQLLLDKAEVGLAYKDTLYVNTNASTFTVAKDPGAAWITAVNKIPEKNAVEIVANVDTYVDNQPRSSYITVTANNVTKKIPVTQRPDRGTISVDNKHLIMSPPHPTKSLSVTSVGGNWKIIGSTLKANPSVTTGSVGTSSLSFTRATTLNDAAFPTVYGDTEVVVKNVTTLDTDTVQLSNLFMFVDDDLIELAQPTVANDTTTIVRNVEVYGASADVELYRKEDWIYPWPYTDFDPVTQEFTFKCDKEPNRDERYGTITLQHADDPDYFLTVQVLQDIIVEIPEFDFYTVTFSWLRSDGKDVDIKCGFSGNEQSVVIGGVTYNSPVPFDEKFVGYAQGSSVSFNGNSLIVWGQDEVDGSYESMFFNAPIINAPPYPGQFGYDNTYVGFLPRKLKLSIGATWFTTSGKGKRIKCTVAAYRGGSYTQVGHRFDFSGTYVYGEEREYAVNYTYSNYFTFCTVTYDRKKHSATVDWANTTRQVSVYVNNGETQDVVKEKRFEPVIHTYSPDYKGVRK